MRTASGTKRPAQGRRRRPTLPRSLDRSTIGAVGLNCRVRDGNGCGPYALVASRTKDIGKGVIVVLVLFRQILHALRVLQGVSQASRAIRTAALGTCYHVSTCGLSTGSSLPAL